jgi:cob(I)alamin adenosyltransferase
MTPCGTTNLIGEHGVKKSDPRIRLIGVLDEASASLSLAKAFCSAGNQSLLETCQKDLSRMMGLLAALPKTPLDDLTGSFAAELGSWKRQSNPSKPGSLTRTRSFIPAAHLPQARSTSRGR